MLGDFIRIAKVASISDPAMAGVLLAQWPEDSDTGDIFEVVYTTPFYSPPQGNEKYKFSGLHACPTEGSFILIMKAWQSASWYYISSIPNDPYNSPEGKKVLTGVDSFPYNSSLPADNLQGHSARPMGVSLAGPGGASLELHDGAAKTDLGWRTLLQSMTKKILIMADNSDFQAFNNEHGDGIKITGPNHLGLNGPRSTTLQSKGNVAIESAEGSVSVSVIGGGMLNLENNSIPMNDLEPSGTTAFPDHSEGEINIASHSNSVVITAHNLASAPNSAKSVAPKGIFIDASAFDGVVQIRAGTGGLEVWSAGDMNFNCGGNFNVNAAGDVNISGQSDPSFTGPPNNNGQTSTGDINLNPPVPVGLQVSQRTKNNVEQYPPQP